LKIGCRGSSWRRAKTLWSVPCSFHQCLSWTKSYQQAQPQFVPAPAVRSSSTKGHQHFQSAAEIYLGLSGLGGLLLCDGEQSRWIDMAPGVAGYIPPNWPHRSVNVGTDPYRFLAVYPGRAGHDSQWVLEYGFGLSAVNVGPGCELLLEGVTRGALAQRQGSEGKVIHAPGA
jgi:mannose-6-phosphate isomerase-like protein (cupin superfamily)